MRDLMWFSRVYIMSRVLTSTKFKLFTVDTVMKRDAKYVMIRGQIRQNTWKFEVFCTISLRWTHYNVHSIRGSAYFDVFRTPGDQQWGTSGCNLFSVLLIFSDFEPPTVWCTWIVLIQSVRHCGSWHSQSLLWFYQILTLISAWCGLMMPHSSWVPRHPRIPGVINLMTFSKVYWSPSEPGKESTQQVTDSVQSVTILSCTSELEPETSSTWSKHSDP